MPLGDGGMACSSHSEFIEWIKYFRNYGKSVDGTKVSYSITDGFNFRMNEVTAALGIIQLERLPEILSWKKELAEKYDQIFERHVKLPLNMVSGYYKYIVFDYGLNEMTGKVFARTDFGPVIEDMDYNLPNSDWIASHHQCAPIWYGWEHADKTTDEIADILLKS